MAENPMAAAQGSQQVIALVHHSCPIVKVSVGPLNFAVVGEESEVRNRLIANYRERSRIKPNPTAGKAVVRHK